MKRFLLCLILALSACSYSLDARAESLVVGLMNVDRPPYFWKDDAGGYQGIFIDILHELKKETGIHFIYKALPMARLRLYMVVGKVDVEMGIDPSLRTARNEAESSIYSEPFMESKEVYVIGASRGNFDYARNVPSGGKFCGVLGFNKPKFVGETYRQALLSETQLLKMINKNRCDYTVMPYDAFRYLKEGQLYNLTTSKPIATHKLRMRLHKQKAELLPRLDAALARMKKDGRLAALLQKYN
ncbi:transporter substrate-binding domain-containing protein [Halodesulfovibrio sp.]|jgi:ABC-type amino acid transport substrate-binding protein|uniref:substrate-binding periplasmic protein n=1 Tax=Halodesulfovibrio sp. TaxID=1912772 RepID=UPI002600FF3A|nr:transporter substrate-binding domain-containing protein [Halodesulfovibrio sp.]MCT4534137.1 transporter substrate-binding domain-containing protein [Halodesulfovibrio sp.]